VLKTLLEMGNLGQKTKAGFYKKVGRDVLRFDLARRTMCPAARRPTRSMAACSRRSAAERLKLLRNAEGAQGQFLWAILRNSFHYAAVHLASIAETARDVDFAMRWGFGMKQGPFELWQEAGWLDVAKMIQEDIDAGKALSKAPCPTGCSRARWPTRAACTPAARLLEPDFGQVRGQAGAAGVPAPAFPRGGAGQPGARL
jgi:3-hydroxyacyl-CoA dehydrogenase